ncbi:MAG: hypothetical protein O6931_09910 [Gammaproteobacteria bacterium]|nr:hypothetical protein [Gammaproteobacteria bacterium]
MSLLLKVFVEIAFFRRGPEDLPASPFLLFLSLLVYAAGSMVTSAVYTEEARLILLEVMADIILMLLWYGVVLAIYKRSARLQQTLTALFGTGGLLYIIAFPVMSWLQQEIGTPSGAQSSVLLMMAILIWSIALAAHIVQRALEVQIAVGLAISIGYFVVSVAVFSFLFGTST